MPADQPSPAVTRRALLQLGAVAAVAPGLVWRRLAVSAGLADVVVVEFSDAGVRQGRGRVPRVVKSDVEWRQQLSPLGFDVTRRGGTERAFSGAYWDQHQKGIFRCVCCETALFGSDKKFDSGTGWPSFWDVIADENVVTHATRVPGETDSELTCVRCDAHIGDVFSEGPQPTGLRYCIDSVALRFAKAP